MNAASNANTAQEGADATTDKLGREVGQFVRAIRSRRGLTRKDLARHSEVSERYLAQLELGTANISLGLLSRVAEALGEPLGSLLPQEERSCIKFAPLGDLIGTFSEDIQQSAYRLLLETFAGKATSCKGVALIGLRGGGKTTLGKRLAERFGVRFVRLHALIEDLAGMDVGELISLTGQTVYRRLELEALQKVIAVKEPFVLETGGSLIAEAETYGLLRESFFTVWIQANPEDHMTRVIAQGDTRPMAGNRQANEDLKIILEEREPYYRLADYQIMTSGFSIAENLEQLAVAAGPYVRNGP